jgi:hypothetical protein
MDSWVAEGVNHFGIKVVQCAKRGVLVLEQEQEGLWRMVYRESRVGSWVQMGIWSYCLLRPMRMGTVMDTDMGMDMDMVMGDIIITELLAAALCSARRLVDLYSRFWAWTDLRKEKQ